MVHVTKLLKGSGPDCWLTVVELVRNLTIGIEQSLRVAPVSYTHLDVYKRQIKG